MNQTGTPATIADAERALGVDSRCVVLEPDPYGCEADETLTAAGSSALTIERARLRLLGRAFAWADVVHFNFGMGISRPLAVPDPPLQSPLRTAYAALLSFREVPLLRRAGKGVFVMYHGSDVRPDSAGELLDDPLARERFTEEGSPGDERVRSRSVEVFDRAAHGIFALTPDLLAFLPSRAQFLPVVTEQREEIRPVPFLEGREELVVAHAPSRRRLKGTDFVLQAVEEARSRGARVRLDLVEDLPYAKALARYRSADLLVDQLVLGWYGAVAIEAMQMGKPVVAYISGDAIGRVEPDLRDALPIIRSGPAELAEVLIDLAEDRRRVRSLGDRSREFVATWHSPATAAALTTRAYWDAMAGPRFRTPTGLAEPRR